MAKKGLVRSFVKKSLAKRNPTEIIKASRVYSDVLTYVAPAAVGYTASRVAGRLARNTLGAKFPKFNKPIQVLANAGTLAALWYTASKVKSLNKYKSGLIAGAGVATVQSLVEFIFPKLLWLFDAVSPQYVAPVTSDGTVESVEGYEEVADDMGEGDGDDDSEDFNTGIFSN